MNDDVREMYESAAYSPRSLADWTTTWHPRNLRAVYYRHQLEVALIAALNEAKVDLENVDVLDVGCGTGGQLRLFLTFGADPQRIHGFDLTPERIDVARRLAPGHYVVGDARELPYEDASMDVVSQFTALSNMTTPGDRAAFASEMARVLRPGGHVVWFDIQRQLPGATTLAVTPTELGRLFPGFEVVVERGLYHLRTEQLAGHPVACAALERLPGPRTNLLAILRKP